MIDNLFVFQPLTKLIKGNIVITIDNEKVTIPRTTWDMLQESSYYHEIIDALEDLEAYLSEKEGLTGYIDYDEYRKSRIA